MPRMTLLMGAWPAPPIPPTAAPLAPTAVRMVRKDMNDHSEADPWFDGESELQRESSARLAVTAAGTLLALLAVGVWLSYATTLEARACGSTTITDAKALERCQRHKDVAGSFQRALVAPVQPAIWALVLSVLNLLMAGLVWTSLTANRPMLATVRPWVLRAGWLAGLAALGLAAWCVALGVAATLEAQQFVGELAK